MHTPTHPATSAPGQVRQADGRSFPDRIQISVPALARGIGIAQLAMAAGLVLLPCAAQAAGSATPQAVVGQIELVQRGSCAHERWLMPLAEQEGAQWLDGLVALFTPIAPECCVVAQQNTQQECNDRDRRVVQELEDQRQHAVLNVVVAGLTLVAGFAVGGGLQGGR